MCLHLSSQRAEPTSDLLACDISGLITTEQKHEPPLPTRAGGEGAQSLWPHPEGHVARKRAAGRYHLDCTGGGAGGYGGRD